MNLLDLYNEKRSGGCGRGGGGAMTLMTAVIESYMLGMCNRRVLESGGGGRGIVVVVVRQFGGPTPCQVRHVDDTAPNLQVCTYMS